MHPSLTAATFHRRVWEHGPAEVLQDIFLAGTDCNIYFLRLKEVFIIMNNFFGFFPFKILSVTLWIRVNFLCLSQQGPVQGVVTVNYLLKEDQPFQAGSVSCWFHWCPLFLDFWRAASIAAHFDTHCMFSPIPHAICLVLFSRIESSIVFTLFSPTIFFLPLITFLIPSFPCFPGSPACLLQLGIAGV